MTRRFAATAAMIVALIGSGCGEGGNGATWDVTVTVVSSEDLGALQLEISGPETGSWAGKGAGVDCGALGSAILAANFAAENRIKVGLISLEGLATPGPILRCGFESGNTPEAEDFTIRIVDAADTDSDPVSPLPIVTVSDIQVR